MRLYVAGSSSSGNCYLLYDEREILILECGVPFKNINGLPFFDLEKVVGCVISHEHGDHAGRMNEFLDYGVDCLASSGTISSLSFTSKRLPLMIEEGVTVMAGAFSIVPFKIAHDANEPLGFLIDHPDTGAILFATDTYMLYYRFPNLRHVMIECNYDRSILDRNVTEGRINKSRRDRTLLSHMELGTCVTTLEANDLSGVDNIILLHLSDDNSDEVLFKEKVSEATQRPTFVATPGLDINLTRPWSR